MARRPSARGIGNITVSTLLLGILVVQAFQATATHQPADKAVANGNKVEIIPPGTATPILAATMKTSKPQDLVFSVTLECSIITQTNNPGGANDSSEAAEGRIRVWVELDEKIVPINTVGTGVPPNTPSPAGADNDKVTFCNRRHESELDDAEDDDDGTDRLRTYLRTKEANAFNWVFLNAGSAVHTIEVFAALEGKTPATSCQSSSTGTTIVTTTCSDGFIGNRTLMVFPERFANDASV